MICPKCGKTIYNDSQFCEYCGAKIEKSNKGLWITLAVIALIAMVGGGVYMYEAQQESLRIERQRLEEENRRAAEREAELEAQLEAERIAKEKAEQARIEAEQKAKAEAEKAKTKNSANGHEWVDLGLPSRTKWATCNVGADSPEEYGDYFAWGETIPKSTYNWSTYKWCKGSYNTQTKYCTDSDYGSVDNKTTLDLSDDAAYTNWGTSWRMPTKAEQYELRNSSYTTWTWTTQNGVKGYKVTSKINGNSIFLPAAGYRSNSDLNGAGSYGSYWSSSLNTYYSDYAYGLYFSSDDVNSSYGNRYNGQSVRPVLR